MSRNPSCRRVLAVAAALAAAFLVASCGGSNPAGTVERRRRRRHRARRLRCRCRSTRSAGPAAAGDPVTVVCQEDAALTATVSGDGRFTLRDLPPGGFTLAVQAGRPSPRHRLVPGREGQPAVVVTVLVTGSGVEVVDEKRDGDEAGDDSSFTCAANAKAEVEGVIASKGATDITVNQTGKGAYLVDVPARHPDQEGQQDLHLRRPRGGLACPRVWHVARLHGRERRQRVPRARERGEGPAGLTHGPRPGASPGARLYSTALFHPRRPRE